MWKERDYQVEPPRWAKPTATAIIAFTIACIVLGFVDGVTYGIVAIVIWAVALTLSTKIRT